MWYHVLEWLEVALRAFRAEADEPVELGARRTARCQRDLRRGNHVAELHGVFDVGDVLWDRVRVGVKRLVDGSGVALCQAQHPRLRDAHSYQASVPAGADERAVRGKRVGLAASSPASDGTRCAQFNHCLLVPVFQNALAAAGDVH